MRIRQTMIQIWRLLCMAATGPGSMLGFGLLALVIVTQLIGIQIQLRMVQWSADFYNALQKLDAPTAVTQIGVFAALAGGSAASYLVGRYTRKALQIRWRRRLSQQFLECWTANKALWLLHPSLAPPADGAAAPIDNPDQRIAEDCNLFVGFILGSDDGARSGVLDFVMSLVGLVSYVLLLWQLATFALSFSLFGFAIEIPRYMVWAAPLYVAVGTALTHLLGRQLSGLLAEEQKREADFRSGLVHVREHAAGIAMNGGEVAERRLLAGKFAAVADIWHRVIRREFIYGLFHRPYFQTVLQIPKFIALPAFLAGKVTLGGLMQVAAAFQQVVTTISWFIFNYKFISDLVATTRRLQRFLDATAAVAPDARGPSRRVRGDDTLALRDVVLRAPDGRELLDIPALWVRKGESVWLSGASGLGKSTLLKAIAGMWPYGAGEIGLPRGRLHVMPQQVYLPLDTLRAAAAYPRSLDEVPPGEVERLLRAVGLGARLDLDAGHAAGLSVGEQQRLALVRLMLARPDWAFLDEATSALDADTERRMLALLRTELPDVTLVMVAHRASAGLDGLRRIVLGEGAAAAPGAPVTATA
ncbi:ABC transporter ATP-binding protein/permease [Bradyrhizobium sp. U87765 SZCCT0131]|uniref:ABC transporter ATP-binding protein/permease n=1 Tax=unclassified Bradyrhizobium TaxID=2631580 RepID=UPI001BA780A3|nr:MULTISPECIES: SbmA/BacA-like family transporter [unclassified Bradyrhizobium]MBR1222307.1 ABC transporter ATP-binding protein/permease [Bradyrhizobium sp. U87765 SZCCT0131]MBR1264209.1 ABC transporter ATP-binding protein/permease [Bradyrhizobium sp. U87765 SZCCT0134]MBR1308008.1 ABC transporter ATP-binding protein/permease [Bradyrhizobium sp. U87765 SZCCT0110]MBR1320459.1 ABC transporter ATP-binding protein/permease [Bradyrhizobium sp. U87765 SZCCT0109]MBR1348428.1 ABC transporter ATP-bindi